MAVKVLVVDDEPNILMTLELVLKTQGLEVSTASNGKLAKALLAQNAFDVVLTDLSLEVPGGGYDLVRAARAQANKPATVVFSGFPDLLMNWESEGADAALQKPTEVTDLLATIQRLVLKRASSSKKRV